MIARAAGAIDDGNFDRIDHQALLVLVEPVRQNHRRGHHLEFQFFQTAGVAIRCQRPLQIEDVGGVPRTIHEDQVWRIAALRRCLAIELHTIETLPVVSRHGFECGLDERQLERLGQDGDVGVGLSQTFDRLLKKLAFPEGHGANERGDVNVVSEDVVLDRFAVGNRRNRAIDQQIQIGLDFGNANDMRMAAQDRWLADAVGTDTEGAIREHRRRGDSRTKNFPGRDRESMRGHSPIPFYEG